MNHSKQAFDQIAAQKRALSKSPMISFKQKIPVFSPSSPLCCLWYHLALNTAGTVVSRTALPLFPSDQFDRTLNRGNKISSTCTLYLRDHCWDHTYSTFSPLVTSSITLESTFAIILKHTTFSVLSRKPLCHTGPFFPFGPHIPNISCTAFFHLRNISRLWLPSLDTVLKSSDSCPAHIPHWPLLHLTFSCIPNHITPLLIQLCWLKVHQRTHYKILLLTFKDLHSLAPCTCQTSTMPTPFPMLYTLPWLLFCSSLHSNSARVPKPWAVLHHNSGTLCVQY